GGGRARLSVRRWTPLHGSGNRRSRARRRARAARRVPVAVRRGATCTARAVRGGRHPPRRARARRTAAGAAAPPVRGGTWKRGRMNPLLLLPAGLTALTALALPLLIHLARRQQQRPTVFAALRWLQA